MLQNGALGNCQWDNFHYFPPLTKINEAWWIERRCRRKFSLFISILAKYIFLGQYSWACKEGGVLKTNENRGVGIEQSWSLSEIWIVWDVSRKRRCDILVWASPTWRATTRKCFRGSAEKCPFWDQVLMKSFQTKSSWSLLRPSPLEILQTCSSSVLWLDRNSEL